MRISVDTLRILAEKDWQAQAVLIYWTQNVIAFDNRRIDLQIHVDDNGVTLVEVVSLPVRKRLKTLHGI